MELRYNAFISYRHHPVDIKVAEQIQRGLEHYRIPKALKKNKDMKLHLFRDKEELPITSNLSGDITLALEKSDFLIVICSTHTKESLWVQREIETFLQTHDHSHVLTVLVDGEPYDTIPEILCSDERIDPVTGEKQIIPIEPLSCDWRVSRQKARQEELPRLAAALLGCGYDELRQREKQYRTRRLAAGLSVALAATVAFSGYVIHNSIQIRRANEELEKANIEIRRNLEEAQINHSQYLAGASTRKLEEGDRMQAIALALAALPEYEGQRPYVAQAEKALSDAVGAYVSEKEIAAVGCISCDALINYFEATDRRDRMFVYDQRDVLSVWDLKTYGKLHSVQLENYCGAMLVTPQDQVIVLVDNMLKCFDRDLKLLWEKENVRQVALSEARDVVLVSMSNATVAFLDAQTGETVYEPVAVQLQENPYFSWRYTFRQQYYDLSRPIVLEYSNYGDDAVIVRVDPADGAVRKLAGVPENYQIRATCTAQSGNILVLLTEHSGNYGRFVDMTTYGRTENRVLCLSPEGKQLWCTDIVTYSYSEKETIHEIDGTGKCFCQVDNMLVVLDAATGEILTDCETGAIPLWVSPDSTGVTVLMEDGSMGVFSYDGDGFSSIRYFKENLGGGFGNGGIYVRQLYSNQILIYSLIMDAGIQLIDDGYVAPSSDGLVCGDYLAMYNYGEVLMFNVRERKLMWRFAEENSMSLRLLGFTDGGEKLWIFGQNTGFLCLNTKTGNKESYGMPQTMDGTSLSLSYYNYTVMDNGVIYTHTKDWGTNKMYLVTFDTAALQSAAMEICDVGVLDFGSDSSILAVNDGRVYFWEDAAKQLYIVDPVSGEKETLPLETTAQPIVQFLNDGKTTMISQDSNVVFYEGDKMLFEKDLKDLRGVAAYHTEQQILVLTDSGLFLRYDLAGEKLAEIESYLYSDYFSSLNADYRPEDIVWTLTGDGDLFVNIFSSGNLIDMDNWEVRAWIPACIAYVAEADVFAVTGKDPDTNRSRIGLYERYSLERIMEMARAALGDYTLTEEQKKSYGIS
jgi:outer membrane protein assembly factor BamB